MKNTLFLQVGETSRAVVTLKRHLARRGFRGKRRLSPESRRLSRDVALALGRYQTAKGLEAHGELDEATIATFPARVRVAIYNTLRREGRLAEQTVTADDAAPAATGNDEVISSAPPPPAPPTPPSDAGDPETTNPPMMLDMDGPFHPYGDGD